MPTPPNPSPVGNARILLIVNICVFSRRVHQKGRMQCVNNLNLADRRRKHFKSSNGVPRENRKQKSKVENENKQGPDWSVVQRCSPSFIRFRENKRFTAQFQDQNVDGVKFEKQIENMNSSNSARPTGQRRTRQNITSGPPYTASNPQLARRHSPIDPPVNSPQANHDTSPDVLGPLFPGVRANSNIF